jgi:twitching motility protein PilT
MTTQSDQLLTLLRKKVISKETAITASNRPEELIKILQNM